MTVVVDSNGAVARLLGPHGEEYERQSNAAPPTPPVPALDLAALPAVPKKEEPTVLEKEEEESDGLKDQLARLNNMGFGTPRANRHALAAAQGNFEVAVDILLTSDYSMVEADGEEAFEVPPPSYRSQEGQ